MSNAIDYQVLLRNGVEHIMAAHIAAKLATKRRVLVKGDATTLAKKIVRGWKGPNLEAFWLLAKLGNSAFITTADLAKQCHTTTKAIGSFRSRLLGIAAMTRSSEGGSIVQEETRFFLRRTELFWSAKGVTMKLNTSMLTWEQSSIITETTHAITVASRDNYAGACDAAEADESHSEEQRTAARKKLTIVEAPIVTKQSGLFDTGTK